MRKGARAPIAEPTHSKMEDVGRERPLTVV